MPKPDQAFVALNVAVLTVSDTRSAANDTSGDTIVEKLLAVGHRVAARAIVRDDVALLQKQFQTWIAASDIDVVISTGGTGLTRRDITPEAVRPFITKPIPGFGELFRALSYEEIGTSTLQSRAEAGVADTTLIFLLPGSTGACRLGMDKIIVPQLDARHRPCNLTELLPRIRHES